MAQTREKHREYMREWRARQRAKVRTEQKYDELERIIARMMPASTLDPNRLFFTRFSQ